MSLPAVVRPSTNILKMTGAPVRKKPFPILLPPCRWLVFSVLSVVVNQRRGMGIPGLYSLYEDYHPWLEDSGGVIGVLSGKGTGDPLLMHIP